MAETSGMAEIRGVDVNKIAIAYQEEARIFRKYCSTSNTSAREIRWYNKTSGILDSTDTTGITASQIANRGFGSRPVVVEQSWTRNTSYVRKYFVESPTISNEDIKDSDIDIFAQNIQDLVIAVENQIDQRIWSVMTEGQSVVNINTNATAAAWNTGSYTGVNIVEDLMEAKQNIRVNSGFSPEGAILFLSPTDHRSMMNWLIDSKGSSIPSFASQRIADGVVMEILGLRVVVSNNVTADYAAVVLPEKAVTWKTFMPLQTAVIIEPLIGKKIRISEEGEAILVRPKCVNLITNTQA